MQPQSTVPNKIKLGAVIGVAVFLVIIAWAISKKPANTTDTQKQTLKMYTSSVIGQNIQCPTKIDSSTIRFYTGSAIAEFNPETLKTKSISPEVPIPQVLGCAWNSSKTKILLEVGKITLIDALYYSADEETIEKDTSWWTLDTNGTTKQVFKARNISSALWDKESIIGVDENNTIIKETTGGSQSTIASLDQGTQLIATTKRGLLTQQDGSLYLQEGASRKKVGDISNRVPLIDSSGAFLVYDDGEEPSDESNTTTVPHGSLHRLNLDNLSDIVIVASDENTNNYALADDDLVILPAISEQESSYASGSTSGFTRIITDLSSEKPTDIGADIADGGYLERISGILCAFRLATDRYLVVDTTNSAFLIGSNTTIQNKETELPFVFMDDSTTETNIAVLDYDASGNILTIYPKKGNTFAARQEIMKSLTNDRSDPNQVEKRWYSPAGGE